MVQQLVGMLDSPHNRRSVVRAQRAACAGVFPYGQVTVRNPLLWDHRANKGSAVLSSPPPDPPSGNADGAEAVTVEYAGEVPPDAKSAETDFQLIWVDKSSGTSLVRCLPKTGRSHQLRIHLASLGFPIANDHLYGGTLGVARPAFTLRRPGDNAEERRAAATLRAAAAAEPRGPAETGTADDSLAKRPRAEAAGGSVLQGAAEAAGPEPADAHGANTQRPEAVPTPAHKIARTDPTPGSGDAPQGTPTATSGGVLAEAVTVTHSEGRAAVAPAAAAAPLLDAGSVEAEARWGTRTDTGVAPVVVPEALRDPMCPHCPYMCPRDYPLDLQPLWLHAEKYSSAEWEFTAPLPDWAAAEYAVAGVSR